MKRVHSHIEAFAEQAKSFAKNPLGIIALFIVLIYALACLVLTLGGLKQLKSAIFARSSL